MGRFYWLLVRFDVHSFFIYFHLEKYAARPLGVTGCRNSCSRECSAGETLVEVNHDPLAFRISSVTYWKSFCEPRLGSFDHL
jgi:hypothetical protein